MNVKIPQNWCLIWEMLLSASVFDLNDNSVPAEFRNGFTFVNADEQVHNFSFSKVKFYKLKILYRGLNCWYFLQSLNGAMERAFKYYKQDPEVWKELVKRAMTIDFSWESSASQYEELYQKSLARARAFAQT